MAAFKKLGKSFLRGLTDYKKQSDKLTVKATVPMVVLWAVVWLSYLNVLVSPYSEILLCVAAAYSVYLSVKASGLRRQLPALILFLFFAVFGSMSYVYNGNAGLDGVLLPALFIAFAVLLLNVRLSERLMCVLSYLSALLWVSASIVKMFSAKIGLCETILNKGFAYVLLFFCVYAVTAYEANKKVSPYLPVCIFLCSVLLLCREGVAIFAIITIAFLIFDFRDGLTVVRNHKRLADRLRNIFNERLKNPQQLAVVLFFAATVFVLFLLYFVRITTAELILIPKNGIFGGPLIKSAVSDSLSSPLNLLFGSKSVLLPSMLKNTSLITSSFFTLHSNYGLGMFLVVIVYVFMMLYRGLKARNYLFLTLFCAVGVRMLFDSAAFPGYLDVAMFFFMLYPFYEKNRLEPVPPVLDGVKTETREMHNKLFFCISGVLTAMLILKLYAPSSEVIDVVSLICMALLVFSPLYAVTPLLITNFFNQAFYVDKIPYAAILSFVFILGLIVHFVRTKRKIPGKYIGLSAFLICWFVISAALGYTHNIDYACLMAVNIVFILLMAFYASDKQTIRWAVKGLYFSCVFILLTVFVLYIFGGGFFREGHFTLNMQTNPNSFAKGIEQLAAIFFGGVLIFRTVKYKLICAFMMILSVFLIFLSGSRSAFIAVALGILSILILYSFFTKRKVRSTEWAIIISVAAAGLAIYVLLWLCNFDMIRRFTVQNVLFSGGTGRTDIWKVIITKIFPDNAFFGVGFGEENVVNAMAKYSTIRPNFSHNFVLGVLVQLGIVGAVVFFVPYVRLLWKIARDRFCDRQMPVFVAMIAFALFNGVGEAIVDLQSMWIAIAFALFLASMSKKEDRSKLCERRYWGIF